MDKVLVKLYVPMFDAQYDIWLPLNRKIYSVIDLLVKAINEFTGGYYKPQKRPMLYDKVTAEVYNVNLKVKDSGIRNSTELVLI